MFNAYTMSKFQNGMILVRIPANFAPIHKSNNRPKMLAVKAVIRLALYGFSTNGGDNN